MVELRTGLSIDGGGVRGIIPAVMLTELERRTGKPVSKMFDAIVGTSTGAILALGLVKPDASNPSKPAFSAADMVALYLNESKNIFRRRALSGARGLVGPKYSPDGIESVLKKYFGDTTFASALTNVIVPAYELEERKHFFFNTYEGETSYVLMWEIARGATAAPTFFPPFRAPIYQYWSWLKRKNKDYLALIDGGVFANNPAAYAVSITTRYEIERRRKPYDEHHPILLLSLGTGAVPPKTTFEEAWEFGMFGWTGPLVDIVFSDPGVEDEVRQLLPFGNYYLRFQPDELASTEADLDNASDLNMQKLKKIAEEYIKKREPDIEYAARHLARERAKECTTSVAR
jgi:uncharacterized protein